MTTATLPSGTGNTTTYAYDDADRLTTVTPPSPASAISYTWDDNRNLTDRGSDSFSWDYEVRMVSATVNSVTTTFAYQGDGLRNSRTVGGNTTTFTWDIAAGLPVVLDDGNQYVYGAGLASMKQSGNWYYYLADGLGSTMAVVDSSGNSQKSYQYDVYGEVTGGSGSLSNEFDFAGQQTDGMGLQYLRARYYDPATGTFLSRDPLTALPGWLGSPHGYSYADPVGRTDPTGLDSPLPDWRRKYNPCEWGVVIQKVCGEAAHQGDRLAAALTSFFDSLPSIIKLLGENVTDVADRVIDALMERAGDPLFWLGVLQFGLGIAAQRVCMAGAVLACAGLVVAYGAVLAIKYALIRDRAESGKMGTREIACRVLVDIANALLPFSSRDPGRNTRFGGGQVRGAVY